MTDRDSLIALLDQFEFVEDKVYKIPVLLEGKQYILQDNDVILGAGEGFVKYYCLFKFDEKGRFQNHSCQDDS